MSEKNTTMPKHGQICWTEIATSDLDGAHQFYSEVFGWNIRKEEGQDFEYRHFSDGGGEDVGGVYEMNAEMFGGHAPPPHFITYISVDDVDKTCEEVVKRGGQVHRPPTDIPGTGRMAVLSDPQGAHFAIITLTGEGA